MLKKPAIVHKSSKIEIFSKKGLFFKPFYDTILSVRKNKAKPIKKQSIYITNIYKRKWSLAGNH